jgi:transcriptional regulator with XRE-family HTH domain
VNSRPEAAAASAGGGHVGPLLRHWRARGGVSQLDLALDADVSSRHLSFVETGRAQPSREMVLRLAGGAGGPVRERNALLLAAGYAPLYRETDLGAPEMVDARHAVEFILAKQEPYPAVVVDRHWNLLLANRPRSVLRPVPARRARGSVNVMRLSLDPQGLRPFVENWEEVARHLVERVHREAAGPPDATTRALLEELLGYPGVRADWRTPQLDRVPAPAARHRLSQGRPAPRRVLDHHHVRHAAGRDAAGAAHRVLLPGGRGDARRCCRRRTPGAERRAIRTCDGRPGARTPGKLGKNAWPVQPSSRIPISDE